MPEPHPPLHRQRTARTNRAYGKTASAISTAVDYGRCETYGIAPPAISHTKAGRICQRHDETGKSRRFQSDTVTAHLTRPAKRPIHTQRGHYRNFPTVFSSTPLSLSSFSTNSRKLHNRHVRPLHTLLPASHIRAYCWERRCNPTRRSSGKSFRSSPIKAVPAQRNTQSAAGNFSLRHFSDP